jgi:glutathione synthase/RimK-type ligase-like ATP-grasp enzyme
MCRILITSSRMPFALDEIRKLGRRGHPLWAADTFGAAPGSHSRYARESFVVPSPRYETAEFIAEVERIVHEHAIDLLVPAFEEVFYLARHRARLGCDLFAPDFETLAELHDKSRFLALAASVGLPVPRGWSVSDRQALFVAARELGEFIARPVYSRGGVRLCTNVGPLAGMLPPQACDPTPARPWLVQEFVRGTEICTFSVVHHGDVVAHSTYVHPRTIEHAGGITFESIAEDGTLEATRRIAAAVGYHGQLSLDFIRDERGLVLIECNPRPCGGVYMMPDEMFVSALLSPRRGQTVCAPAGVARKVSVALLRALTLDRRERGANLRALFSRARDVYLDPTDPLPLLWVLLSYRHVVDYRRRTAGIDKRTSLLAAYFDDVLWDGEPIALTSDASAIAAQ